MLQSQALRRSAHLLRCSSINGRGSMHNHQCQLACQYTIARFLSSQCRLGVQIAAFLTGTCIQTNGYATDQLTAGMTLMNKGVKAGPGGRSSVCLDMLVPALSPLHVCVCNHPIWLQISGITATVFGCSGFLARYVINGLTKAGTTVVLPYRCDDLDAQHLSTLGDLGQVHRGARG